jgi:hypothetical protein
MLMMTANDAWSISCQSKELTEKYLKTINQSIIEVCKKGGSSINVDIPNQHIESITGTMKDLGYTYSVQASTQKRATIRFSWKPII